MRDVRLSFASSLDAPAEDVWAWATSVEGINSELGAAFLHMRFPRGIERLTPDTVTVGEPLASIPLIFGSWIPVDASELTIAELGPGHRFLERSPMRMMTQWEHERTVRPRDTGGCTVVDNLHFTPRMLRGASIRVIEFVFGRRHARLQERFGALAGPPAP